MCRSVGSFGLRTHELVNRSNKNELIQQINRQCDLDLMETEALLLTKTQFHDYPDFVSCSGLLSSMTCLRQCQFCCVYFQDVFPLQPFEKDDQPVLDQSEKDVCDKVEQLEKTPRKMLSRGEMINWLCFFVCLFFLPSFSLCLVLDFHPQIFKVKHLKKQSGWCQGKHICSRRK